MAIQARPYVDDDLGQAQAELAGWIEAAGPCGYCLVGELAHRIYAGLRGRLPVGELVQIWEDGRSIVGLAINFRFEAAFDLFVSPAWRGGEVELAMLQSAYETTRRHMQRSAAAGQGVITDVFSCDTTRRGLLSQLGFVEYRQWDDLLGRDLSAIPEPQLASGFRLRHAAWGDYGQLAAARNDAFGDDWSADLYRDAVMRKPGYQPEREIVVIAPDGQIAAFTMIWLDGRNKTGQFEPVGTRRAFQRQGLARAMMCHGLHEMRRLGMQRALVEHDATNLAARDLYRSLGFSKLRETLGYRRDA
jgi:ribosomal protein S18 acetylase RimI-like enzyme